MIRLKIAKRSSSVKSRRQGIRALRQSPTFRNASAIKSEQRLLRIVLTAKMKKLQHTKNKAIKKRFSSNNRTVPILQSLGLVSYHHSLACSNHHHRFSFFISFYKMPESYILFTATYTIYHTINAALSYALPP
jgi:hypothetical protein